MRISKLSENVANTTQGENKDVTNSPVDYASDKPERWVCRNISKTDSSVSFITFKIQPSKLYFFFDFYFLFPSFMKQTKYFQYSNKAWKKKFSKEMIPIQSPNRINCCHRESHLLSNDDNNNLHDICGIIRKCCKMNCVTPTAMSFGYEDERNTEENLFPTVSSDNVFYIESSGARSLDIRQACSVESFARLNPTKTTYVLMIPKGGAQIDIKATTMKNLMENYKNIRIRKLHLDDYFAGTPLQQWYHCSDWNYVPYFRIPLSDGLRLLTLFKYGGYYFDLDIIHLKPIKKGLYNFLVKVWRPPTQVFTGDDAFFNNAVIHAEAQHPLLSMSLEDFRINYRYI